MSEDTFVTTRKLRGCGVVSTQACPEGETFAKLQDLQDMIDFNAKVVETNPSVREIAWKLHQ